MNPTIRASRNQEADELRSHLQQLLQQVCATVADPVRPEPLRQAIAMSQRTLAGPRR